MGFDTLFDSEVNIFNNRNDLKLKDFVLLGGKTVALDQS